MLKHQLQNKKKAKYEIRNFCEQYGLSPIAPFREKGMKHGKSHKSYSHKKYEKYKNNFVKPNNFYAKKKNVSEKYDKQPGKNKFSMLNIDNKDQEELFKILESNNLSDSLKDDFSSSSISCYQSANVSSDPPNIKIGCGNSCCNNIKYVKTLTKCEKNETDKKQKSTINFEETLKRLNKQKSKNLTVNDL